MEDAIIYLYVKFKGMGFDEETAWNMAMVRSLDEHNNDSSSSNTESLKECETELEADGEDDLEDDGEAGLEWLISNK